MRNRPVLTFIGFLTMLLLLTGVCAAGFFAGMTYQTAGRPPVAELPGLAPGLLNSGSRPTPAGAEEATPPELQTLFKPFWQTWKLVNEIYVEQPIDPVILMRGAISGMLESLGDAHTSYLDPVMEKATEARLEGQEYEGIGAWVDITKEYLTIISPMPKSPAEKAGLRPGDQIIAIDGEDMTGKDGEYARQRVIGPSGTTVLLTVLRENEAEPFEVEVKRASIEVPTVVGEMLQDENIAYVRLYTFGDDTAETLKDTLRELLRQNPDGLILDVRNNGGGYLTTAIQVTSQFIGEGDLMIEEFGDGRREVFQANPGGVATKIPMVVLINQGSASASEILAGSIQDYNRGYLVGETTYGKGSVQNYIQLGDNNGAVRITVARWLTPLGRQINEIGLNPDFPVEFTDADYESGRDPQLEKAVEVLTKKLIPEPTPIPTPTPTPTPVP